MALAKTFILNTKITNEFHKYSQIHLRLLFRMKKAVQNAQLFIFYVELIFTTLLPE